MKVILVYDISTEDEGASKRLRRALQVARKYLHHVQKSVFEGELTISQIAKLKRDILKEVDRRKDSVIIYTFPEGVSIKREILTEAEDRTENII